MRRRKREFSVQLPPQTPVRLHPSPSLHISPELGTRHIYDDMSCCFIDVPHVTAVFILHFPPRHRRFAWRVKRHPFFPRIIKNILFNSLKLLNTPPLHPAVILHPFWRSKSPFPAQWSFFTLSGDQIPPSTPSGHFHPFCRSNSHTTRIVI